MAKNLHARNSIKKLKSEAVVQAAKVTKGTPITRHRPQVHLLQIGVHVQSLANGIPRGISRVYVLHGIYHLSKHIDRCHAFCLAS